MSMRRPAAEAFGQVLLHPNKDVDAQGALGAPQNGPSLDDQP